MKGQVIQWFVRGCEGGKMKIKGTIWNQKIVLFIFVLIFLTGIIIAATSKNVTKTVPCYDRYNNKINGLTCQSQGTNTKEGIAIMIIGAIGGMFTAMDLSLTGGWNNTGED